MKTPKDRSVGADSKNMKKDTHIGDTVRIRRPPRVTTDELGHNVWMSGVDELELEESKLEIDGEHGENYDPYDTAAGNAWTDKVKKILRTPD